MVKAFKTAVFSALAVSVLVCAAEEEPWHPARLIDMIIAAHIAIFPNFLFFIAK